MSKRAADDDTWSDESRSKRQHCESDTKQIHLEQNVEVGGGTDVGRTTVSKTETADDDLKKPRRALSAYNFFLREERQRILSSMGSSKDNDSKQDKDEKAPANEKGGATTNNSITFEEMGKLIGKRWKEVKSNPDLLAKYTKLAEDDRKRYSEDMDRYNEKKKQLILKSMAYDPNKAGNPADSDSGGSPLERVSNRSLLADAAAAGAERTLNDPSLEPMMPLPKSAEHPLELLSAPLGRGAGLHPGFRPSLVLPGASYGDPAGMRGYHEMSPDIMYSRAGIPQQQMLSEAHVGGIMHDQHLLSYLDPSGLNPLHHQNRFYQRVSAHPSLPVELASRHGFIGGRAPYRIPQHHLPSESELIQLQGSPVPVRPGNPAVFDPVSVQYARLLAGSQAQGGIGTPDAQVLSQRDHQSQDYVDTDRTGLPR